MRGSRALPVLLCGFVLIQLLAAQIDAQRSRSPWQTLSGDAPLVIARGGFSGLFPDSSLDAYNFAMQTSVPGVVLWCDVQLTKDGIGICFPDLTMSNASNIDTAYPSRRNTYTVNGVATQAWFTVDFSMRDLSKVFLIRGILARSEKFDGNGYAIQTVQGLATQLKPDFFWLNVQHEAFYTQQNLSMSSFLLSASKSVTIDFISSPEVNFFRKIAGRFGRNGPSFVFSFLGKDDFEPTTTQTYRSILSNLTFVKTFASGILVPKSYILSLGNDMYLRPPTSLVQDAHKAGLQVFVSGFANDADIAYDYSFDPVSEYLSFVDNGNFSVDGVVSDFPITASASIDCFSHVGSKATKQADFLVISKNGAGGDYPGCTNLAYENAIQDGADVIDCSVQMSSDGKPFCLSSIDLGSSTRIATSSFRNRSKIVPEINSVGGIYAFRLTWLEIQNLTPSISNPFKTIYNMVRNPKKATSGKLLSLSEFLNLAKNSTSLSGVIISVENAAYLREKQGLDVVKAVLDTLTDTGYSNRTATKVMIQSTNSSVLVDFKKHSQYETVYKVEEAIRDIHADAIEYIKTFATAVVIKKSSVFHLADSFIAGQTNVVEKLQKSGLPVYVETFRNEFVSQPYDYFADATVEINSFVSGASINGTITEFPRTAARYKTKNQCLASNEAPLYMAPVEPGGLLRIVSPQSFPPAEAPNPVFTEANVTEPPLPPVTAKAPTSTPATSGTPSTNAQAPSGQTRVTLSLLLSVFAMVLASLLLV